MNSHADNRSEIRATRIDEWNEDTERKPNGGIEVNASRCIVDTGERRNSVIRGSGSRSKGRHDIVRFAQIRTVTIFLFLVSFSYPNKRYSQRSTFISAL